MLFDISSAPEEYQRRQHELIARLDKTECVVDDVLMYGRGDTYDEAVKDHDINIKTL